MRLLVIFAATACLAAASTVTCNNNSGDVGLIQSALNDGGTVTITGTCAVGGSSLVPVGPVTINGSATLNGSGASDIIFYGGNGLSVNGLTFNGGGIHGISTHYQGAWSITNCTFRNISTGNMAYGAILVDHILAGPPNTPGPRSTE